MGMMNKEIYDAFVAAGIDVDKAEAAASSIGDTNQLVTKADLVAEIAKIEVKIASLDTKFNFLIVLVIAVFVKSFF